VLTTQQFETEYLPPNWEEKHLQLYIQKKLKRYNLIAAPDEVKVKTPSCKRRIDLCLTVPVLGAIANYEVKKYLTYDSIFHAVAQLELYGHYGGKILGLVPRHRIVIGLTPADPKEYQKAERLAQDFRGMGISVVFANQCNNWHIIPKWLIAVGCALPAFFLSLFAALFLR
jgi:hypothetical protein